MEPITMFATTVGFIAVVHLLSQAAEYFGHGRFSTPPVTGKRKDWYCFFQLSDLCGKEDGNTMERQPTLNETDRIAERRQQQANRPRLQV